MSHVVTYNSGGRESQPERSDTLESHSWGSCGRAAQGVVVGMVNEIG